MADHVERASAWIYSGVWRALSNLFLVPRDAPTMPAGSHEIIASYRPAPGYLRYVKFFFWIGLLAIDVWLSAAWIVIAIVSPIAGILLFVPGLILIIVPDVFAYVAIHLRYDTTWYVLTDRSMRLRGGVLLLTETTITYENVQNVAVEQGPLQRYFGISSLVVHTAGGGGGGRQGKTGGMSHLGRLEGIATEDAMKLRDTIMARAKASRSAGLGDDHAAHDASGQTLASNPGITVDWAQAHIGVLRQIRDDLARVM